jgi:hypothetical protein
MDAVDYAIAIAQRDEAELTALYVVSSPTTFGVSAITFTFSLTPANALIQQPEVDPKRISMIGHSSGEQDSISRQ